MDIAQLAVETLRTVPYGFLVTPATPPTARLVQHLHVDDDAAVWIGTSPRSRKASSIATHGAATYVVEDRDRFAYVSVAGTADVVTDLATRNRMWEEGLRAFFPAGPEGDDFVLVRLTPDVVEAMSFADGVHPDPYGLVPCRVERREGAWREVEPERARGH
ncbi:MAG: stress protein [Acidimicrobiaceae bacterium]|nr:stress protein [Acidimicrobiaceae bacterium]